MMHCRSSVSMDLGLGLYAYDNIVALMLAAFVAFVIGAGYLC